MGKEKTFRMGSVTVEADNLDKVFFPDSGLTKGDLVEYYRRIAETMLPHARDRAVSMHRFPDGIEEEGFYHKDTPDYFPDWISRKKLDNREGGDTTYVVIDRAATLVYLADQGTITPHVWLSRTDRPERPDRLIFDLDPPGDDFGPVREVVVPLDRSADFEEARSFARDLAELVARRDPGSFTTEHRKAKRKGRIFLDVMRNAYAQTGVPPYAVRARPGAPVAAPIDWKELGDSSLKPDTYTIRSVFRRLSQKEDPWKGIGRHARSIDGPHQKLRELLRLL